MHINIDKRIPGDDTYFDLLQSHLSFCLLALSLRHSTLSFFILQLFQDIEVPVTQNCWLVFCLISTVRPRQCCVSAPSRRTIRGVAGDQVRPLIGWCSSALASNLSSEVTPETGDWILILTWSRDLQLNACVSGETAPDWPSPTSDAHWANKRLLEHL